MSSTDFKAGEVLPTADNSRLLPCLLEFFLHVVTGYRRRAGMARSAGSEQWLTKAVYPKSSLCLSAAGCSKDC